MNSTTKNISRARRHTRVRAKVLGSALRPRLSVYKSNRYLHAQIIDDEAGKTLVSASTQLVAKEVKKIDAAKMLGQEIARRAIAAGATRVVFDRGGFRYTGRIATFADAARAGGLIF